MSEGRSTSDWSKTMGHKPTCLGVSCWGSAHSVYIYIYLSQTWCEWRTVCAIRYQTSKLDQTASRRLRVCAGISDEQSAGIQDDL